MRNPQKAALSAAAFMVGTLALGLQGGVAWAAGGATGTGANQPPGNNGTVKIDGSTMDPGQDNDPHLTCDFSVSFYGYDGGPQSASLTVTPVAPTPGNSSYTASTSWNNVGTRTSGSQFDRNVTVSWSQLSSALSGVTPQAQQGYHLRLEVEVTGSQGSDDKYKVFWLQPCAPVTSPAGDTPTTTSTTTTTTTTTVPAVNNSSTGDTTTTTSSTTAATVPPRVASGSGKATTSTAGTAESSAVALGRSIPVATASRPVSVAGTGGSLAFTGADVAGLSAAGLGLIGAGAFLTLRSRRKQQQPTGQ